MMARTRNRTLILGGGVLLVGLVVAWAHWRGAGAYQYRTMPVTRGDLNLTISATGTPNAVVTVQVGTQVSGIIQALYADFNTRVQKGQLVARIDPTIFEARVNQAAASLEAARSAVINMRAMIQKATAEVAGARAGVASAQANVVKARVTAQGEKLKLDRRVALVNEGVLSKEDLDTEQATYDSSAAMLEAAQAEERAAAQNVTAAEAQLEVAQTQLASAEAQVRQNEAALKQAQTDLDHTYIRAPVDGVVVARRVDVGQTVAASLQAPTLFEIAQDLTKMQVDTNVSEADVGRVQLAQRATFGVDAYPGQFFHGAVIAIRKAPINVQNVVTYDVVIAVANPDLKLFPGMTANVRIQVGRREGVLKVPNAALRFHPPDAGTQAAQATPPGRGNRQVAEQRVWVLGKDGRPLAVTVTTGLTDGTFTEITGGGLKEQDPVVVAAVLRAEASRSSAPGTPMGGPSSDRGPRF